MCLAICYTLNGRVVITHFTDARAKIPALGQSNPDHFLPWGRRLEEAGELPLGSCLSLDQKAKGLYDKFFPKPVKIKAHKFMEQNVAGQCRWFEIIEGRYLQGLLLRGHDEQRLYVVTFVPEKPQTPFQRWPFIVTDDLAEQGTRR